MPMRENENGEWEVKVGDDYWHAFKTRHDANLVASAGYLFFGSLPKIDTMKATVDALEQTGACKHPEVNGFYEQLKKAIEKRENAL